MGGRLYAVGGERPGGFFRNVDGLDPVARSWRTITPLPDARHGIGIAVVGDALYAIGGGGTAPVTLAGFNTALTIP